MDLTKKDYYVPGGQLTDPSSSMDYPIIFSRDSVCIALLVDDIDDLGILYGDIKNTYLNAPMKDKLYLYSGK